MDFFAHSPKRVCSPGLGTGLSPNTGPGPGLSPAWWKAPKFMDIWISFGVYMFIDFYDIYGLLMDFIDCLRLVLIMYGFPYTFATKRFQPKPRRKPKPKHRPKPKPKLSMVDTKSTKSVWISGFP